MSAAGYLIADAVSMHEGLGRHDRLLSATSLLGYSHLLVKLGGDLFRRGSGLDRHHPGLAAFENGLSTALEFWRRRRQERHHLWPLVGHTHTYRSKVGGAALLTFPSGSSSSILQY